MQYILTIQHIIGGSRWRMFGHDVLRMSNEVPAKSITKHYFDPRKKSFFVKPRTTLPILLDKDLKTANALIPKQLQTLSDLDQLEILANERSLWKTIVANMQVSFAAEADENNTSTAQEYQLSSSSNHSKLIVKRGIGS